MTDNENVTNQSMLEKLQEHKLPLLIVALFIVFGCSAPYLFSRNAKLNVVFDEQTAQVGDTIGGTMGPFIAIAGAILTFLAFYIQYESNIFQRNAFKTQLTDQKTQFLKAQFSNHFFELLRIHKDNVANLCVKEGDVIIAGEDFFSNSKLELSLYIQMLGYVWANKKKTPKEILRKSYFYYFNGLNENEFVIYDSRDNDETDDQFHQILAGFKNFQRHPINTAAENAMRNIPDYASFNFPDVQYLFLVDKSSMLSKYYRHLYHTVKYVTNQNVSIISIEEKQDYLKTLRAQLSNDEQLLLFYNWYSGYGEKWEGVNATDNKFFTRFKMIHNINKADLEGCFKLEEIFADYCDPECISQMF